MSNLLKHAEREMRLAGLYDKDSDYGGMIPASVLKVVKAFSEEGHSGGSASITLLILEKVLRFKTLSPLTSDPEEWMDVAEPDGKRKAVWQNTRDSSYFSEDAGKTWYCIDDPDKKNWPKNR